MANNSLYEGIHDVISQTINEQKNSNRDWSNEVTAKFSVNGSINRLVECAINDGNFMNVLESYRKQIEDGCPEVALFESYIKAISKYNNIPKVKAEINSLVENLQNNESIFASLMLFESIDNNQAKQMVRMPLMRYLYNGSGKNELMECLSTLTMLGDPVGDKLTSIITESFTGSLAAKNIGVIGGDRTKTRKLNEKKVRNIVDETIKEMNEAQEAEDSRIMALSEQYANASYDEEYSLSENFNNGPINIIGSNLNEDAYLAAKLFGKKEEKESIDMNAVYEAVDNYIAAKEEENKARRIDESSKYKLVNRINNNGLHLDKTIKKLYEKLSVKNNKKLVSILAQYESAISQGAYQERLYETFISALSNYTYLQPVQTELDALGKRINTNRVDIDLTKIMETMLDTTSYYLVPLIEEDVTRYMEDKNPTNRVQLINCLSAFHGDPFIDEMMQIVSLDQSRINAEIKESEQTIINHKDQIKFLKEQAQVSNIYSPVQYIKENESVFCVNGEFFVKKNNTINKLDRRMATNLSEQFINLSKLINSPRVIIESDDCIEYRDGNNTFYIFEGGVKCGDKFETLATLKNLSEMFLKYNNYDAQLYNNLAYLLENFNNIARVDFAKHIELKENQDINLDMFRCGNQIFINTHNDAINENIFYRNVNPIQCSKIINEHMGMNVSNLFEDLMPNQKDIIAALNEADTTYQESIDKLKSAIEKLEAAKEGASEDDIKKLDKAIEDTQAQLEDAEAEYKEFQNKSDELTDKDGDDADDLDAEDNDAEDVGDIDQSNDNKPADEVTDDDMLDFTSSITGEDNDSEIDADAETDEDPFANAEGLDMSIGNDADSESDDEIDPEEAFANSFLGDMSDDEIEETPAPEDNIDLGLEGETEETINSDEPIAEVPEAENDLADEPTDAFVDDELEEVTEPADFDSTNDDIKMISFDENIVTGEVQKSGQVVVVTPMVGAGGKKYLSNQTINFVIDNENNVVLSDSGNITVDMYHAIVDSIKADPNFDIVASQGMDSNIDTTAAEDDAEVEAEQLGNEPATDPLDDLVTPDDLVWPEEEAEIAPLPASVPPATEAEPTAPATAQDSADDTFMSGEFYSGDELDDAEFDDIFKDLKTPTYVKDGTIMDFPADNADPSVIKESKLINIKAETKSGRFFVNESKTKKAHINENEIENEVEASESEDDLSNDPVIIFEVFKKFAKESIEDYTNSIDIDTESSIPLIYNDDNYIDVENFEEIDPEDMDKEPDVRRFTIIADNVDDYVNNKMCVYLVDDKVYYKSADEVEYIFDKFANTEERKEALQYINFGYNDQVEMDYVDIHNDEDLFFLLYTIMSTMTGEEFEKILAPNPDNEGFKPNDYIVDESVKIRKHKDVSEDKLFIKQNGLTTDFDDSRSLQTQEIKFGTEQDKKDKEELERVKDEQNKLNDSEQHPELPNKHKSKLSEAKYIDTPNIEPGYKVLYTPEKQKGVKLPFKNKKARVLNVMPSEGKVTIILDNDHTKVVKTSELQLIDYPGAVIDNTGIKADGYTQDLDSIAMPAEPHNDRNGSDFDKWVCKPVDYAETIKENANIKVPVNIVFEGYKMNNEPCKANAMDIVKNRSYIHVINENMIEDLYPAETIQLIPQKEDVWAWAVYTIKDDNEPQRKVKVSIPSWQEHINDDEALIDVLINDKPAQLPKATLKIIS